MANKIVTKQSLINMINQATPAKQKQIVGRALVAIFNNQTTSEQKDNDVKEYNNIGFTGGDGRSGCISAKYFLKHHTLEDWQLEKWLKPRTDGTPRIAKYHAQLNQVAQIKQAEQTMFK